MVFQGNFQGLKGVGTLTYQNGDKISGKIVDSDGNMMFIHAGGYEMIGN